MSTVQTQESPSVIDSTKHVPWNRLWLAGLIAVVGSIIVNTIIRLIALAVLSIPTTFMALSTPIIVIAFTFVGTLGALGVFALMNRFARNPIRLFRIVALIAVILSFIPTLLLFFNPMENVAGIYTLLVMHITTYLICVGALTRTPSATAQ